MAHYGTWVDQGFFARGHDDSPLAVGGPAQVHPHEWSAVTYNPLSCAINSMVQVEWEVRESGLLLPEHETRVPGVVSVRTSTFPSYGF